MPTLKHVPILRKCSGVCGKAFPQVQIANVMRVKKKKNYAMTKEIFWFINHDHGGTRCQIIFTF